MVLQLIWSTRWLCLYVLQRSLALMIKTTVEGQWPRFVVSTATDWTLRSLPKMNCASVIINVAVQVNAGWKYNDSQHRHFRFRYFLYWWRRSWLSQPWNEPPGGRYWIEMSDRGFVCVLGASLDCSTSDGIRSTKQHGISWRGIRKGCKVVRWCLLGVRVVAVDRPSSSCVWFLSGGRTMDYNFGFGGQ